MFLWVLYTAVAAKTVHFLILLDGLEAMAIFVRERTPAKPRETCAF